MFRRKLAIAAAACSAVTGAVADAGLHDPMRPYQPPSAAAAVAPDGWRLSTIVRSADRQVAVINGKALKVGDRIGDAELAAIEPWQVTLKQGEKRIVIPLGRARVWGDMIKREEKP